METPSRPHVLTRAVRIAGGTATTLTGVALLVLPGPGIVLIVAGLGILRKETAPQVMRAARRRGRGLRRRASRHGAPGGPIPVAPST